MFTHRILTRARCPMGVYALSAGSIERIQGLLDKFNSIFNYFDLSILKVVGDNSKCDSKVKKKKISKLIDNYHLHNLKSSPSNLVYYIYLPNGRPLVGYKINNVHESCS